MDDKRRIRRIGWSVPEYLVNSKGIPCPFVLISRNIVSFHEEIMLCRGVLWPWAEWGRSNDKTVNYAVPIIISCLGSGDNTLRGYAALALGRWGVKHQ